MLSSCAAADPAFVNIFYRSHIYLVVSFVLSPVSRDQIAKILSKVGNDILTLEPSAGQLFSVLDLEAELI
jgi:arsenate reductase-like glutaredoxin family protein